MVSPDFRICNVYRPLPTSNTLQHPCNEDPCVFQKEHANTLPQLWAHPV